jgi:Tol biopolymer transport system component
MTKPELFAATADWSRSGQIVYSARVTAGEEGDDLYTILSDGGQATRLTFEVDEGGSAMEPSWSADAESLVFVNANNALMRLNLDSGEVESAFAATIFANHPRARPSR